MASEDELRVVRCSHSELEELAEYLEMPREKTPVKGPKSQSKSTRKYHKDSDGEGSDKRSDVLQHRKQNKPATPGYDSNQSIRKCTKSTNSKNSVKDEVANERNVVVNNGQKAKLMSRKQVRVSDSHNKTKSKRQTVQTNSDNVSDSDYDRGENHYSISSRSLYDPQTNSNNATDTKRLEASRKRGNFSPNTSRTFAIHNLTDTMDKLHVADNGGEPVDSLDSSKNGLHVSENRQFEDGKQNLKKMQRRKAEELFADVGYLEGNINNLLSRRLSNEEQLHYILKLSSKIQEKCRSIMLTDLYFFTSKEVYHMLWRSGFYQIIERLRGLQKDHQEYDGLNIDLARNIPHILQGYFESGSIFFHGLVSTLEKEHGFVLKTFLEKPGTQDCCSRPIKMALLCCHHFMIFLGDIERYKQHLLSVKEWSMARSCYLKACKITPRNGKPYNQLAVIAVYAKRRLDAVYYYIRSLTVSNPIMTAREKLHAIFDDVQRKAYEWHVRAMEMEGHLHHQRKAENQMENHMRHGRRRCRSEGTESAEVLNDKATFGEGRHELWVFYRGGVRREFLFTPDGMVKGGSDKQEKNERTEKPGVKISLDEINKQFEVFFLCAHAMLYSKIGIDHFSDNHRKVLGLFKTLLRHPTCAAVKAKRLLEMTAINMFEIANVTSEDHGQLLEGTPSDLAMNLGSDMFQCICKATSEVLQRCGSSNGANSPDDELCRVILANYLPAIKVWLDWMRYNITLLRTSSISVKEDFWSCVAVLLNSLSQVCAIDEFTEILPGDLIVTLMEDDYLSGFKLLALAAKPRVKVESVSDKEMACKRLRIEAIQDSAKFFCEFEDLPLRFNETTSQHYITKTAVTAATDGASETDDVDEIKEEDIDDDVIVESVEDVDSDSESTNPVKELKAKKDALTKEILNQKQREEDAKAVLVEHSSKPTLVLEINPQYLVPDTNCFIDHLPDLRYIVESKDFTIVIPLVVINELDGLAKGTSAVDQNQRQQRADFVADRSRAAIDFLEYRFSLADSQMLALTSKGSVLSTIAFRSEEPTKGRGINDDVILNCCQHYCDVKMDIVNKLASADQPFTIRRKVVLLTEDRNLRLKAHVQNIPVVNVPRFLEMIMS